MLMDMTPTPAIEALIRDRLVAFFGEHIVAFCEERGIRVRSLEPGQSYDEASPALNRLCVGVDRWPLPPAGLFVVQERTVYLRSTDDMTLSHEFSHGLDCALGNGVYLSSVDHRIRRAFARVAAFVSPYSATAVDEYFAEAGRSWVGGNTTPSLWPRVSRERLWSVDPSMAAIMLEIMTDPYAVAQTT